MDVLPPATAGLIFKTVLVLLFPGNEALSPQDKPIKFKPSLGKIALSLYLYDYFEIILPLL